jgi:hypothetical protein
MVCCEGCASGMKKCASGLGGLGAVTMPGVPVPMGPGAQNRPDPPRPAWTILDAQVGCETADYDPRVPRQISIT